jgi:hypothetical protein
LDVVGQSVEQRTGQPLGPEHAGPFVEWQIASDDGGAALVALAEDLKQQLGAGRRQGYIAELIDEVWLDLRFTLSYRDVEDLLAERGLDISYETVRSWVLKFGPVIARRLQRRRPRPSDR